jgi:hypothetical protein
LPECREKSHLFSLSLSDTLWRQFGFDFTVYGSSINVVSILVFASNRSLATTKNVFIFDRAIDAELVRTDFDAGLVSRVGFVSRPVAAVLHPGVYSIVVNWTGADLCTRGFPGTDERVVRTTAGVSGLKSSATILFSTTTVAPTDLLGVTFRFTIIPNEPPPLAIATDFADCEAVACAGLPTGEYSVGGGKRTFCDNDEAGGGWTRIWRLNDSSCEDHGWSSGRNVRANGIDPFGCNGGFGCRQSKNITTTNNWGEVMGKNWEMWAHGTPDSFRGDDGVFVTVDTQRLWTFSVGLWGAGFPAFTRCPCDPLFSTNISIVIARINETGDSYICDAAARTDVFSPVFQANGSNLCSPRGKDRRSFLKVLTDVQRKLPLRVHICLDSGAADEDIKLSALDLFARQTPRFNRTRDCPARTTSIATAAATATPPSTTTGMPTTTMRSSTSAEQRLNTTAASAPAGSDVALIAGAVGGAIGAVLLAAAIFLIVKRAQSSQKKTAAAASSSIENYGVLPNITDVAPVSIYDVGNVTLPRESASSAAPH